MDASQVNHYAHPGELINLKPPKPLLRYVRGMWRCGYKWREMPLHWSWGRTPKEAFDRREK